MAHSRPLFLERALYVFLARAAGMLPQLVSSSTFSKTKANVQMDAADEPLAMAPPSAHW